MSVPDGSLLPVKARTPGALPLVSVIAPVYNEGRVVGELFQRIVKAAASLSDRYRFEFVFVDDGSRDDSLAVCRALTVGEPRLRVVELRRNYGQTAALQAGLDAADGDVLITMDADLQHFPEEIPQFLEKIEAGFDLVCGWRANRQEGLKRRFPSKVANYILRRISKLTINDIGTTYRAYRREIMQDVRLLGENHRFVPIFASVAGARIAEIPIQNIERPVGQANYGLERTLNVFIDMVFLYFFVRFMDRPIRVFGRVALLCFGLGLSISAGLLFVWARTGGPVVREHSGWFLLAALFMLAGLQSLMTGIVSEMLARIYYPSREHAPYKVRTTWTANGPLSPGSP
ncbi:MAG TPA: glycosyltransferase family 2 protein [Polyangiaceae bacterium]|nr:glycosyltransferase family 2 protein [Polyangiaceae bacterium]